jgi:limonene-1,2-epoxide hydrolase
MSAIETVQNFVSALEDRRNDDAANALSDEFLFTGWTPKPLNKEDFLTTMKELKSGIPSLMFNLHNLAEEGNTITGSIQIAGYQSDSFSIPPLSLPPIPQMARSVSLPVEDVTFEVETDKISAWVVHRVPGGGVSGLLHQLGFDSPIIQ